MIMKNTEQLFTIQDSILEISYSYQSKSRTKRFLICDTTKVETLKKYLSLSDSTWLKKNCENLVQHWVLESLDSLLEELVD